MREDNPRVHNDILNSGLPCEGHRVDGQAFSTTVGLRMGGRGLVTAKESVLKIHDGKPQEDKQRDHGDCFSQETH